METVTFITLIFLVSKQIKRKFTFIFDYISKENLKSSWRMREIANLRHIEKKESLYFNAVAANQNK